MRWPARPASVARAISSPSSTSVERLRVVHDGHDETVVARDRDTDVARVVVHELVGVGVVARVEDRAHSPRATTAARTKNAVRVMSAPSLGAHGGVRVEQRAGVDLVEQRDVRHRAPRLGHVVGHRAPDAAQRLAAGHRRLVACDAARRSAAVTRPPGPVPATSARSMPELARQLAHRRRRLHRARAGAARCRGPARAGPTPGCSGRGARGRGRARACRRSRCPASGTSSRGRAHGNEVADLGAERHHGARRGHRQLDLGLVGLHVGDDLVARHVVTHRDAPLHQLGLGHALAEIGQEVLHATQASRDASSAATTRATSGRHQSSTSGGGEPTS